MIWPKRFLNTAHIGLLSRFERHLPFQPFHKIEQLQRKRLRTIIKHAYETVPFYRNAMREQGLLPEQFHSVDDLARLPLIDSVMVRRNPEQFLSSEYQTKNCQVLCSGRGKTVHWDNASSLRKLAYAERDRGVLNSMLGQGWGHCQLYLLPEKSMSLSLRNFWDSQLVMPKKLAERHFFSVEKPLAVAIEKMNAVRPQVVYSYGSYADQFFRFLRAQRLRPVLPKVWVYGGDMLPCGSKENIERDFDCIIYSTYQSVETGRLGFQCEARHDFHLNIDLCAVRLIDEDGNTAKINEPGEIVISNLYNRAMVLLNYRLNDRGVLNHKPCTCGRSLPLLEEFDGHYTGNITLPDGQNISTTVLQVACLDLLENTLEYQVKQTTPTEIAWQIVPFSDVNLESIKNSIIKKTLEVLEQDLIVSVTFVEQISRNASGKFQFGERV